MKWQDQDRQRARFARYEAAEAVPVCICGTDREAAVEGKCPKHPDRDDGYATMIQIRRSRER